MKNIIIVLLCSVVFSAKSQTQDTMYCFTREQTIDIAKHIQLGDQIIKEQNYRISIYDEILQRDSIVIAQHELQAKINFNVINDNNITISKLKKRGVIAAISGIVAGIITTYLIVR